MGKAVVCGAMIMCDKCPAPGNLIVTSSADNGCSMPVANNNDAKPGANIPPFPAPCTALGYPTPCVPGTSSWDSSSKVNVRGAPIVNDGCSASCALGGKVKVLSAGQGKVNS